MQINDAQEIARQFPTLIYGADDKLRIMLPYRDLLLAFRSHLDRSQELQVCSYSLRDLPIQRMRLRTYAVP
jgi:hypothetical protein